MQQQYDSEKMSYELSLAAPYRNALAWRVVIECVWGIGLWVLVAYLAMNGLVPYWLACLANGWIAYLMYMPLHEAAHDNVRGQFKEYQWLNDLVGHVSSIPLWFSFRAHRLSHKKHHAHTNEPKQDPDYFISGKAWRIFPKMVVGSIIQIVYALESLLPGKNILPERIVKKMEAMSSVEILRHERQFYYVCLTVFVMLSLTGYFWQALLLWYLPSRIGQFLIALLFGWLPHHPHKELGRYRDTRITLFPGSRLLLRGQDRHLLHHMFPRIPHYHLPALFKEIRPHLQANNAAIQGPLAGPGADKIQLT